MTNHVISFGLEKEVAKSILGSLSSGKSFKSLIGSLKRTVLEGGYGEGGGRRVQDGEHSIPVADSFRCLVKLIQCCKV